MIREQRESQTASSTREPRRLATFPRGESEELRVELAEYEGKPFHFGSRLVRGNRRSLASDEKRGERSHARARRCWRASWLIPRYERTGQEEWGRQVTDGALKLLPGQGSQPQPVDEDLWLPERAAQFLGMSIHWVYRTAERGELSPYRKIGSRLRFVPAEIRAWVNRGKVTRADGIRQEQGREVAGALSGGSRASGPSWA